MVTQDPNPIIRETTWGYKCRRKLRTKEFEKDLLAGRLEGNSYSLPDSIKRRAKEGTLARYTEYP